MPLTLWWLSFADGTRPKGQQFLGACIMPGKSADTEGMKHAIEGAHILGCNPGGEVAGEPLPPEIAERVTPKWVGVLLNREQCEAFDREMGHGVN